MLGRKMSTIILRVKMLNEHRPRLKLDFCEESRAEFDPAQKNTRQTEILNGSRWGFAWGVFKVRFERVA